MRVRALSFAIAGGLTLATAANVEQRAIDGERSTMTVRVYKAGLLSAFGHDHEISAPVSGTVDIDGRRVEVRTNARALEVRDRGVPDKDRMEIQTTMLGPQVLDAAQYPEIIFRSTAVDKAGAGLWRVRGSLTLHGQTHEVLVEARETDNHFVGASRFKQTDFGIKPVKVAGGSVRVKDEVRVEFDIQLAR